MAAPSRPLYRLVGFRVAAHPLVPPLPVGGIPLTHSPRREVASGPAHTRGAHPAASGRLSTVALFRQPYPALHERWRCFRSRTLRFFEVTLFQRGTASDNTLDWTIQLNNGVVHTLKGFQP